MKGAYRTVQYTVNYYNIALRNLSLFTPLHTRKKLSFLAPGGMGVAAMSEPTLADGIQCEATAGSSRLFDVRSLNASSTIELRSGERMPIFGLGGGIFAGDVAGAFGAALAEGYRMFDTAPKYGPSEKSLGRAIQESNVPRADLFLITKIGNVGAAAALQSFEKSLRDLRTDYVDLLLMHSAVYQPVARNPASRQHGKMRMETWRAMQGLRQSGRARALGVCNHSPRQLDELTSVAVPDVVQAEFHPMLQPRELLDYSRRHGIALLGYGNGGGGWQLWRKHPELDLLSSPPIQEAARAHGKSAHQVSLRWSLEQGVCVIPKSEDRQHQRSNRDVFDFALSDAERARIDALGGESSPGSLYRFPDPDAFA
jgi:diketogulonate reductase-like aldo/keto reductase